MPPSASVTLTTAPATTTPDPVRRAADQRQHLARRRELRHQVQGADHEDDHRATACAARREPSRASAKSGTVSAPVRRMGAATSVEHRT